MANLFIPRVRITDTHAYFWNSIFSNYHPCVFTYEGATFQNSEQAFMWCKAHYFGDSEMCAQILKEPVPAEAKKLGRKVKGYSDAFWFPVRYKFMKEVLTAKFTQNPLLLKQLLAVGDRTFVEGSPVDTHWGVGIKWTSNEILDEKNWKGQNLLGKALKDVQNSLK